MNLSDVAASLRTEEENAYYRYFFYPVKTTREQAIRLFAVCADDPCLTHKTIQIDDGRSCHDGTETKSVSETGPMDAFLDFCDFNGVDTLSLSAKYKGKPFGLMLFLDPLQFRLSDRKEDPADLQGLERRFCLSHPTHFVRIYSCAFLKDRDALARWVCSLNERSAELYIKRIEADDFLSNHDGSRSIQCSPTDVETVTSACIDPQYECITMIGTWMGKPFVLFIGPGTDKVSLCGRKSCLADIPSLERLLSFEKIAKSERRIAWK